MVKTFVGIDPDIDGSGVAILKVERVVGFNNKPKVDVEIKNVDLPGLLGMFAAMKGSEQGELKIIVEAGWKVTRNWHLTRRDSLRMAAEIGRRTGRNHQIAIDIAAIARSFGLNVIERLPLVKRWKGKDGKITHDEIAYFTGIKQKRTNQEQRDALLLAWNESGLPIRVKV